MNLSSTCSASKGTAQTVLVVTCSACSGAVAVIAYPAHYSISLIWIEGMNLMACCSLCNTRSLFCRGAQLLEAGAQVLVQGMAGEYSLQALVLRWVHSSWIFRANPGEMVGGFGLICDLECWPVLVQYRRCLEWMSDPGALH